MFPSEQDNNVQTARQPKRSHDFSQESDGQAGNQTYTVLNRPARQAASMSGTPFSIQSLNCKNDCVQNHRKTTQCIVLMPQCSSKSEAQTQTKLFSTSYLHRCIIRFDTQLEKRTSINIHQLTEIVGFCHLLLCVSSLFKDGSVLR